MPRTRQTGTEPPSKRVKLDKSAKGQFIFTSADEIRRTFRTQEQDSLVEALTALRNQLTVEPNEVLSLQDERLLLAQHWLELAPGVQDLFDAWEGSHQRQISSLFISVVASLLVLSSHYTHQSLGQPIIKTLLSPQWMRRLNSNLNSSHNELILVTLRLFNTMSAFAGGRERKSVLEAFSWENKSLPKLLFMRRKSHNARDNILVRPDIRTSYVQFILSFLDQESSTLVKATFLEQHHEVFLSIFKGITQDPYLIICKILEVCWTGIWSDPKIKRTLKINLFSEPTIFQLIKLYDRVAPENAEADHVPADLVHHFLLAICTRPGVGICFRDRGWYPRESDGDDRTTNVEDGSVLQKGGKIYNKILASLLKVLKVNEDTRQQELALKIMMACPELVAGYWSATALTLEPRLSSKWIANIAFFGSVIALPIPSSSFLLPDSGLFQPSPPPLSILLENILPSVNTKNNMSKGLQSTSPLVQHCTALALAKCLVKYANVIRAFHNVQCALEEDEEEGQWCKRRQEIEREIRRRVPEFQVIVGYSQHKLDDGAGQVASSGQTNLTKTALISESAQRLLWLYHWCLPLLVAEARFDVGKLLQTFLEPRLRETEHDLQEGMPSGTIGLRTIRELHVLRLLKESNQFVWSGKSAFSSHTYLYILLKAYNTTELQATRIAITSLLKEILSDSILFQEDPEELYLWLDALPVTRRVSGAEAPDGAPLTDEGDSVISFLDDCIQRCLKTPYRYIEDRDVLARSTSRRASDDNGNSAAYQEVHCSPLLITVLDQLSAKLAGKLLTPSDALAITSFIRRLVFKLSSKQRDLDFLRAFVDRVDSLVHTSLFPQYPSITAAICREMPILRITLHHLQSIFEPRPSITGLPVQEFLDRIEQLPTPAPGISCATLAYELSDWLRLTDSALHPGELNRLVSIIDRFYPPALKEFLQNLNPDQGWLWDAISDRPTILNSLSFDWLFISTNRAMLEDKVTRDTLVEVLFAHTTTLVEVQRAMCLIIHGLSHVRDQATTQKDLLLLSAAIVQRARGTLTTAEFAAIQNQLFVQSGEIKVLCFSKSLKCVTQEGLKLLVDVALDYTSEDDRKIARELSAYWMDIVKYTAASRGEFEPDLAILWIRYLESEELCILLNDFCDDANPRAATLEILEAALVTLRASAANDGFQGLRLGQLFTLRSFLNSSVLEDMIAMVVNSHLPVAHHGRLPEAPVAEHHYSLRTLVNLAEARWNCFRGSCEKLDLLPFLTQTPWTGFTVQIVSAILYSQPASRQSYLLWLSTDHHTPVATHHLATTLHAYLDCVIQQTDVISATESDILLSQFSRLLSSSCRDTTSQTSRFVYSACLFLIIKRSGSKFAEFLPILQKHIESKSNNHSGYEFLLLGKKLHSLLLDDATEIVTSIVDLALQMVVRLFSGVVSESVDDAKFIDELTELIRSISFVKTHLAEPVIIAAIQNCLSDAAALKLVALLIQRAPFKPAYVNRYLQNIVQSPRFFEICAAPTACDISHPRDTIIEILHILFYLHPNNTCQVSHLEPLAHIYGGTLSKTDRHLLSIFQLFETQRKSSITSIIVRWHSPPNVTLITPLQALQALDPTRVLRTCLMYPTRRCFTEELDEKERAYDSQIYDPVFVLLLFALMLMESPPESALEWVQLCRTNVVSLLIRSLSANDSGIRRTALCQIAGLWNCLEVADMQERPHVLYILTLLKNTFPSPSHEHVPRLTSYASLVLLHAVRGVFYPSSFVYPLTARFLLQRPELDTNDVPMLYNMLYNSSDDWKRERTWIIRLLSDGMMSTSDWLVFKRRHTWDLLSSMFQSSKMDHTLRHGILQVLANLTCNTQATTSLILKSSLLIWIEMQLKFTGRDEGIAWVKVLENIITVVDPLKLEASTNGEWRDALCRCLTLLVCNDHSASAIATFALAVPVALRLSLLPGTCSTHLQLLVNRLLLFLMQFEMHIKHSASYRKTISNASSPPHSAFRLHEAPACDDHVQVWGDAVEALWRITMTFETKISAWDTLTCRLLLWRAMVGEDASVVGEWARREVIGAHKLMQ